MSPGLRRRGAVDEGGGISARPLEVHGRSISYDFHQKIKQPEVLALRFPPVLEESKVGEYPASAKAGGGFVWDAVLEYRVWCHPHPGAPDEADGSDYYYAFATYEEADAFARAGEGTEKPLALILQQEYIAEPESGKYVHVREQRIAEWPVAFLLRPKRDAFTIPEFLAVDAPANRLEVLRGLAPRVNHNVVDPDRRA